MIPVSKKAARPRVRFDPDGYRRARKRYDAGDERELIAMMREAATDSLVAGCLTGRRSGFKRPFNITFFDDTEAGEERRAFIQSILERLRLRDLLQDIHDARLYLYNVLDFDWEVIDGRQVPVEINNYEFYHFRRTERGGPLLIDHGSRVEPIPEDALVIESRHMPLMLPVLRDYILREFGLESYASFLENFGEPFILGRYPAGADDAFKAEVEEGVNKIAASARGIAPAGTDLEIVETSRTSAGHDRFIEIADRGISIALLGHENAVRNAGGIQVGAQQTSYQVRHDIAEDDMLWIEPFVNRLIQQIVDRNFGDGRYPRFELDKSKPIDPRVFADNLDMAWRHGVTIHPDNYRRLGIKLMPDQEPVTRTTSLDVLLD